MSERSRVREALWRVLVLAVVCSLLGSGWVVAGVGSASTTAGNTVVVAADGSGEYDTIQAGVDAASAGDTVEVRPGTYTEAVLVETELTLVAPNGATLDGSGLGATSTGLTIDRTLSSGLTVEGFTIQNYGDGIGVGASADEDSPGYHNDDYGEDDVAGGWTVRDVLVRDNAEDGIDVGPTTGGGWTMHNVTATGNGDQGIEVGGYGGTAAWTISASDASANDDKGIYVSLSTGTWELLDSNTSDNGDTGVYVTSRDSAWTIGNHTASDNSFNGIDIAGSFSGDWTIHNTTASDNNGFGIGSGGGIEGNWVVRDSVVAGNYDYGVYVPNAPDDFRIQNVTVRDNDQGGVSVYNTAGNWRIDDSRVVNNGDYRGYYGINAELTEGVWAIDNSTISGNVNGGINATKGLDGRPVGDATGNWWGQSSGPAAGQCVGNVDCDPYLTSAPGGSGAPTTTAVEGTVTDAGGDPLSGVDVTVFRDDGSGAFVLVGTETTAADGTYGVADIDATGGSADLKLQFAASAVDYEAEWYDDAASESGATVVTASAGATESGLDAQLVEVTPAVVAGTVTNESGDPLSGIEVTVYRDDGTGTYSEYATATTETDGTYSADVFPPSGTTTASVKLQFEDPTSTYALRWYDDALGERTATALSVDAGTTTTADAALPVNVGGVVGTVTNANGDPLSGVEVTLYLDDGTGTYGEYTTVTTDASGGYTLDVEVPDGQSAARFELEFADPAGEYRTEWYENATSRPNAARRTVYGGNTLRLDGVLERRYGTFTGTVRDESGDPLSGIEVTAFRDDGTGRFVQDGTVTTDASGRYESDVVIPPISGDTLLIQLRYSDPTGTYETEWHDDADRPNADRVTLTRGIRTTVLGTTLAEATSGSGPSDTPESTDDAEPSTAPVTVTGTVTNESGAPLPSVVVVVYRENETGTYTQSAVAGTDETGEYSATVELLDGETSTRVQVGFFDPDDGYVNQYYDDAERADANGLHLDGGTTRRVDQTLTAVDDVTVGYSGVVTDEQGRPLEGIEVTAFRDDGTGTFREYRTELTDSNGLYDIDVWPTVPDEDRVRVKLRFTDPDWDYAQWWYDDRERTEAAVLSSTVGYGYVDQNVTLQENVVTVAGRVRNVDRETLEGIMVLVYTRDDTGAFVAPRVARVFTDEFGRYSTEVAVPDGQTEMDLKVGFADPDDVYDSRYWRNATTLREGEVIDALAGWELPNVMATLPREEDVTATYFGTVYAEDTDDPLEDVRVTVFRDDGTGTFREWTTARTEENGYWEAWVHPPAGERNVSVKIRYRDETGRYLPEWEFDEPNRSTATVVTLSVGEGAPLYGTQLAPAPTAHVSGVVFNESNGVLPGIEVTLYRKDGPGRSETFATTTTDDVGYYEFDVPAPPGETTVETRLHFDDPSGEYAQAWYEDRRRWANATAMRTQVGDADLHNFQTLREAGLLLDVWVQPLSTCPDPADEDSCTFPNRSSSITVDPDETVAVRYDLWNGDDGIYSDYSVSDPATGRTMFGANTEVAPGDIVSSTTTLSAPIVDGTYAYRVNGTTETTFGRTVNVTDTYTVAVSGSVAQQARTPDGFGARVSNAGAGDPVLVGDGDGVAAANGTTMQSLLLRTDGGNYTLNVTGDGSAPNGTTPLSLAPGGTAFSYFTVEHSVPNAAVENVTFRFRVDRLGLTDADVSPGNVTLYRYVDGTPTALQTDVVGGSSGGYVFEATSPGLSVFAVAAGPLAESPSTPTVTPAPTTTTSDPTSTPTVTAVPTGTATPTRTAAATTTATAGDGPGFTGAAAVLGVVLGGLLLRSRRD